MIGKYIGNNIRYGARDPVSRKRSKQDISSFSCRFRHHNITQLIIGFNYEKVEFFENIKQDVTQIISGKEIGAKFLLARGKFPDVKKNVFRFWLRKEKCN